MKSYWNVCLVFILVGLRRLLGVTIMALGALRRIAIYLGRVAKRLGEEIEAIRYRLRTWHKRIQAWTFDVVVTSPMPDIGGELILTAYRRFGLLRLHMEVLSRRIERGDKAAITATAELYIHSGDLGAAIPLLRDVCTDVEALSRRECTAVARLLLQVMILRDALSLDMKGPNTTLARIAQMVDGTELYSTGVRLCDSAIAKADRDEAHLLKAEILFRMGKYEQAASIISKLNDSGRLPDLRDYVRWAESLERIDALDEAIEVLKSGMDSHGGWNSTSEVMRLVEMMFRQRGATEASTHLGSMLRGMRIGQFSDEA